MFDFHFEDATRSWDQEVDFRADPTDPTMTFSANPGWRLSEFEEHRSVLRTVIKLRNEIKVISLTAARV